MDPRAKSLLLIVLIVGVVGYFYSRDQASRDLAASATPEIVAPIPLPKQVESSRQTASSLPQTDVDANSEVYEKPKAGAPAEFTVSEEERQRIYSEIKSNLASIYVAQKAFFAETGRYSTDLKAIGWDPLDGEINLKVGFLEPSTEGDLVPDETPQGRMDSDYLMGLKIDPLSGDKVSYEYSKFAQNISLKNFSQYCRRGCSATSNRFEVMAISKTGPHGEPEAWIIDDDKNIIKVTE
ncbi:hypothetical protein [Bdellovibrio sp. HCB337]|uniref:hypothetical protein n=1 Tax=Bdellovibrio sp. HCB337 TaxID=3394358 RepID=UPI0039A78382